MIDYYFARCLCVLAGLAGVYHIGDHYKHEEWRGVAQLSGMCPAMYGPDHFQRFSPTTILLSLDAPIRQVGAHFCVLDFFTYIFFIFECHHLLPFSTEIFVLNSLREKKKYQIKVIVCCSLPQMVLVHGTKDYTVPVSSSQKLVEVLSRTSSSVSLRIIPDCDHFDICFDLMKPSRRFHSAVMTILMETAQGVF